MKLIILAFIISISLHLLLFNNYKNEKESENKQEIKKNTKKSDVKFVKLQKKEPKVEKEIIKKKELPVEKKVQKPKIIEKPKVVEKPKKEVVKEKKYIKAKEPIKYQEKRVVKKAKEFQNKVLNEQIVKKESSIQNKTLEDFLSQKEPVDNRILSEIERLYGREFETFTKVQKAFLEKNLNSFQVITQRVLNRLGYPRLAAKLRIAGTNIVEFMFYPDGSIKDLKITNSSGYEIFDSYSLELIQIAYKDYPRPSTPTKLKFNVQYRLY